MRKLPIVKSSRIIHDGFVSLREDLLEQDGGYVQPMNTFECVDATTLLAQDSKGRWILNSEYRHPTGQILLGCPGGRLEAGEDPVAGGKREFFEETGYWADDVVILGCSYPFPGLCNQKIYHLLAIGAVKKGDAKHDPFEFIETELLTDEELRKRILSGAPVDGILLTALWLYNQKKDHFC
jgi:ADP-ribose pyrophosphatase